MVPTAPRYFPTEEQFQDPLAFVQAIRAEAEPYGICSIRPPASWAPPYAMDKARFSFKTRLQAIHELSDRGGSACQQWRASYNKFLAVTGSKVSRKNPILNGTSIDLPKLHKAVQKRGGYQAVIDDKKWKEVARIVGVSAPPSFSPGIQLHTFHSAKPVDIFSFS
jgi:histone demethylase JARID1